MNPCRGVRAAQLPNQLGCTGDRLFVSCRFKRGTDESTHGLDIRVEIGLVEVPPVDVHWGGLTEYADTGAQKIGCTTSACFDDGVRSLQLV